MNSRGPGPPANRLTANVVTRKLDVREAAMRSLDEKTLVKEELSADSNTSEDEAMELER
jgi:hypothetical protein